MRTQRAHRLRRLRRWVASPALVGAGSLAFAAAAAAQGGGDSSDGGGGSSTAVLLLGGAAAVVLVAVLVEHLWRRRSPSGLPASSPRKPPHTGRPRALGYTTFPERRRAVSPESRYQARRIKAACEARGIALHQLVGDVESYSGPDLDRPGLNHALELLSAGEAGCLVVAGLDRLSRSAANLGTVIEWLEQGGARLVVIDIDLDTDTEEGRLAARALVRVGALERRSGVGAIASRAGSREQPGRGAHGPGRGVPGPGRARPAVADLPLLQRRIATMRAGGMTLQAIADTLNSEGVPTVRGGAKWRPSSVQAATGYRRPSRSEAERPREG